MSTEDGMEAVKQAKNEIDDAISDLEGLSLAIVDDYENGALDGSLSILDRVVGNLENVIKDLENVEEDDDDE